MNPDQYCVFGNPIAHSKSPLIHAAFALQTGLALVYERRLAPLDGFALAARTFAAEGGKGANGSTVRAISWARPSWRSARAVPRQPR